VVVLGRTAEGKLLFGYCRLPWVEYTEPIPSVRCPEVSGQDGKHVLRIDVSNHGQVASEPSEIQIAATGLTAVTAACPAREPYGKTTIDVPLPESFKAGKSCDLQITTGSHLQQAMVFTAKELDSQAATCAHRARMFPSEQRERRGTRAYSLVGCGPPALVPL